MTAWQKEINTFLCSGIAINRKAKTFYCHAVIRHGKVLITAKSSEGEANSRGKIQILGLGRLDAPCSITNVCFCNRSDTSDVALDRYDHYLGFE